MGGGCRRCRTYFVVERCCRSFCDRSASVTWHATRFQVTAKEDGNAHFDAFQVSKQCMEMVAEGALEVGERPAGNTGGQLNRSPLVWIKLH